MTLLTPRCYGVTLLIILVCITSICVSRESIIGETASEQTAEETQVRDGLLQFVRIPAVALPEGVRLVKGIRTASIMPTDKNPDVWGDPRRITSLAVFFGIQDSPSDLESVSAGVIAVYQHKNPPHEIGVYGLYYADEAIAKERFAKLAKGERPPPFILKGKLLLFVWEDDAVSDAAYREVHDYFMKTNFPCSRATPFPGSSVFEIPRDP